MNPMFAAALGSLIRFGFAFLAGYLVKKGVWGEGEAATYVTAATTFVTVLVWDQLQLIWNRRKLVTALATPGVASEAEVEAKIKATEKRPPVTMDKERTPYPVGTANPNPHPKQG
jgi:hypothetical protein